MLTANEVTNEVSSVMSRGHAGAESSNIGKIYFYGVGGDRVKIGWTNGPLAKRRKGLENGQFIKQDINFLAAFNGSKTHEAMLHDALAECRDKESGSTELFVLTNELFEYINWIRQQWWAYIIETDHVDEVRAFDEWRPSKEHSASFDEDDPTELFPSSRTYEGPLANKEPWNRLSTPTQELGEDFYTPPEVINAARQAMGEIDLDAASHWRANKVHRISKYFHHHRSAFQNPWHGRVWLNPPHSNYKPWFDCIIKYWDSKEITQLCMIAPVWAFTTEIARPFIQRWRAMILLSPTPKFWGSPDGGTGSNHPHAIVYLGDRVNEFKEAFKGMGHPFKFDV